MTAAVDPPSPRHGQTSEETGRRLVAAAGALSTAAVRRMDAQHPWYRELSAENRSWVGLVAQAGITSFIAWHQDSATLSDDIVQVFDTAPRELTRSINLRQTLDLVRTVIAEVEAQVATLAAPGDEMALYAAVLDYSREIAFAAAQVYAQAAEMRGAWDARLESLVVDAVLRGEADDSLQSRVTALGWDRVTSVTVLVGSAPGGSSASAVDGLRAAARRHGVELLAAVQGRRLVAVLGSVEDPIAIARHLLPQFGDGPLVAGPVVPHLFAAGRSARTALAGWAAAPGWPEGPRPCSGEELVAERALNGDERARRRLTLQITQPIAAHPSLHETARSYLSTGSLEATARALFVHPNTVRYRLGRIAELTGYDLTNGHDGFTVRLALTWALMEDAPRLRRTRATPPGTTTPPSTPLRTPDDGRAAASVLEESSKSG